MSYQQTASIEDILRESLQSAGEEIGRDQVAQIQDALSVPVERDFAGRVIVRSSPGEPPRMEDDILRQNVEHHLTDTNGIPSVEITSHRPPDTISGNSDLDPDAAVVLELGLKNLQGGRRPYMEPAVDRLVATASEVYARHIQGNLT